jgi:hypothetical protein
MAEGWKPVLQEHSFYRSWERVQDREERRPQGPVASITFTLFLGLDFRLLTLLCAQANNRSRHLKADSCTGLDSSQSKITAALAY